MIFKKDDTRRTEETEFSPMDREHVRWIYDYTELYWEIKAKLKGGWLTMDKDGNYRIKIPQGAVPMMNDRGIEETMSLINGFVNKIQALTQYDEDRILEWCMKIDIALAHKYYINMENYSIDPINADIVIDMIMNLIESNLRKSHGAIGLKTTSQSERVITEHRQGRDRRSMI